MNPTTTTSIDAKALCQAIRAQITRVVAIDLEVVDVLIVALLAKGHVMIEGIPGIGKTLLARTLTRCVGCGFRRIQFTNDLMPSDIVGSTVWRQSKERFTFSRGPLFTNIVLADEINRTSPRTLSCLLEAMENGLVSIEGQTVPLPHPFFVLATRNPIEFHGTYPIPEAALDRFLVRASLDYPTEEMEMELYQGRNPEDELADLEPLLEPDQLLGMMEAVVGVEIREAVVHYCYRVIEATRRHEATALGASPRAGLAWLHASRARAYMQGREAVLPDDLMAMAQPVLAHRIFLKGSGEAREVLEQIISEVPVEL